MASDAQPPHPQQHSILPDYNQLIMEAIEALNEPNGANKSTIAKQIESVHSDLPAAHTTLLSHHLNKMKQSGQLLLVKNNYMKPDPTAPPRRGRGRPPKPKDPFAPVAVQSPPRPRGRPPKPRDPFAPPPPPKSPTGSGRPRGRPPNPTKAAAPVSASAPVTGVKRGRGRPPKVKPAVAPVGC